jgi:eukaryotic-like serine/threonine-protein kinase
MLYVTAQQEMPSDAGRPPTRPSYPPASGGIGPDGEIRLGEVVAGKYLIESYLGTGGMGAVLRAQHLQLDQPVAIKVMRRDQVSLEDAARRFALEARATAALKSPHAVRILDVDRTAGGSPFIVMELLEGIDLGTMVTTRGFLPVDRAIHYLLQATEAIAEAHSHHIIHRDIKPGNLFLTKEGIIKVLDFGLAKALRPTGNMPPVSSRTVTNMLIGSPNYMSPEQMWPGREVDERTDIWGLGATMFQLLTGEPPFPAPSLHALMTRIATEDPPRVTARRNDVSPTLDGIVSRCLQRNPDDRYRSIAAFQGSLLHVRAELQLVRSLHPASLEGAITATGGSMMGGATMPATTRRVPQDPHQFPTLPPSTKPDSQYPPPPGPQVAGPVSQQPVPSRPPVSWQGDDEPTEISATTPDETPGHKGSLGVTRKA